MRKNCRKLMAVVCLSLYANYGWSVLGVGDVVHDPIIFQQNLSQWLERIEQWKHQMNAYHEQIKLMKGSKKYGVIAEQMLSQLPQDWNSVIPNSAPDLSHTTFINDNKSNFYLKQFQMMINEYNESRNRLQRIQNIAMQINGTEGPKEAADLNNRLQAEALLMQENENRLSALQSNFELEDKLAEYYKKLKNKCFNRDQAIKDDPRVPPLAECAQLEQSRADFRSNNHSDQRMQNNNSNTAENNSTSKAPKGWKLGDTSERYESNGEGPGTINTKKAAQSDPGGRSYGPFQISQSTMSGEYVKLSKYKDEFKGLKVDTPAFDAKWKEIAQRDPKGFFEDQKDFIRKTHFEPQMRKLKKNGIDLSDRGPAVQDAIWSTSVQYRNNTQIIFGQALKGKDISKMSDDQIIDAVQNNKKNRAIRLEKREDRKKALLNRVEDERKTLHILNKKANNYQD